MTSANARRQAQLRQARALGRHTREEWLAKRAAYGGRCAYCARKGAADLEHVIPMSLGGSDAIDNIVPSCRSCNSRKRNTVGLWVPLVPPLDDTTAPCEAAVAAAERPPRQPLTPEQQIRRRSERHTATRDEWALLGALRAGWTMTPTGVGNRVVLLLTSPKAGNKRAHRQRALRALDVLWTANEKALRRQASDAPSSGA